MISNVNVLMTVYNEEYFIDYAIRACLPYIKTLTIVEGAYLETIALGASPRSSDKTIDIIETHKKNNSKITFLYANEKSDQQQRNVGLNYIKASDPNSWLLIIDGDEIYEPFSFKMIQSLTRKMENNSHRAAYFNSLTFVNDFQHYCNQEFPRLFKLTQQSSFVNDNYMRWEQPFTWQAPEIIKVPIIKFFHYSFCKSKERFNLKKRWWQNRFQDKKFQYSWRLDKNGNVEDDHHSIKEYRGKHPQIMLSHPLAKESYNAQQTRNI